MMRKLRNRQRGFTLIELLIVIAIIGIIAALLIPNFLDALNKAKQKRSMGDIKDTGTAWMSWLTDQFGAAAAAGAAQTVSLPSSTPSQVVKADLRPQYIQEVKQLDAWNNTLTYCRRASSLPSSRGGQGGSRPSPSSRADGTARLPPHARARSLRALSTRRTTTRISSGLTASSFVIPRRPPPAAEPSFRPVAPGMFVPGEVLETARHLGGRFRLILSRRDPRRARARNRLAPAACGPAGGPRPSPSRGPGAERRAGDVSEAARWLQAYLRIDTTDPPGHEERGAAYLADLLHREGISTTLLVSPEGRASLYARLRSSMPAGAAAGPVILLHHIDVVPAGPDWTIEPFAGTVKKGRLWGRGALDIKSLGIAELAAVIDLHRRHVPLARDVIYLAAADEERGGRQGVGWLLRSHPELFAGAAGVLNEGGANRTVNGRALWAGIEVAQKRPLWLRISASGRPGHGSGLNPSSATHQLIRGLARVLDLPPRWKVTEAARLYLGALAPLHNAKYRRIFTHLDDVVHEDGPTEDLMPGLANLFLDTFQVTVLRSGEKINVIPGEAGAQVDARLLPETDGQAYLARVKEALGGGLRVEVLLTSPPVPPSPVDDPIYRAVAGVLAKTAPVVPAFIAGFTDSRYFRERGIPAYGVSPFFLEPQDFLGIHGPDESIPLVELDRGVERMKRIVEACATSSGR